MLKKGFLKPELSIDTIGKSKFWTGIILGICAAFVLSLLLNYSRETFRMITFLRDPLILSDEEFRLFDLFFAALSTSLGFGVTLAYWLIGKNHSIRKDFLKVFAISNTSFISISALAIVAKFGSNLAIVPYGLHGYDNQLDFLHDHRLLLVLIPIYIFFNHWINIRLIFKVKKWISTSIIICVSIGLILFKTTFVEREILNNVFYNRNKEKFDYIENEFLKAQQIGIFFSDTTRQILQKKYADRIFNLVCKLKESFKNNEIVQLDTLILEKIVVHNLNRHENIWFRHINDYDKNWPYVMPEEIYYQIFRHDNVNLETQLLFEILHEQILLFTAAEIDRSQIKNYTRYEREKYWFKEDLLRNTSTIQSRLIQVAQKLKSDQRYGIYHHLLPEIEFSDNEGHQLFYELDFNRISGLRED